mmetsp:Transcript_8397/g.9490  ORF Transcript_8397/g.9490 Transcript_8397/m.9490 type:complete len:120 (+) Transcript_8397:14-373(+)
MDISSDHEGEGNIPSDLRRLRACLRCHLIKKEKQFSKGCENCPILNELASNFVRDCTTTNFEGMLCIMKPDESWVSRYQLVRDIKPGMYCLRVFSDLSEDILRELEDKGIQYIRSTDQS